MCAYVYVSGKYNQCNLFDIYFLVIYHMIYEMRE